MRESRSEVPAVSPALAPWAAVLLMAGLFLVFLLVPSAVVRAAAFLDVGRSHPYRLQIEVVAQLGVTSGYDGERFAPEDPLTRQQFAKFVVLAMRIPVSEEDVVQFGDVSISGSRELFPDNYIAAAAREGITKGTQAAGAGGKPLFSPYAPITRAQLVTMASRASGRALAYPPPGYRPVWGDFSPDHGPAARTAQYNGLLRELPLDRMNPWQPATRAEAAALLFNLMGTDPEGLNGRFLGTSSDLVRYFRDRGGCGELFTLPLEDLARLYVRMGRRFGVRADMAWAQMIHETGFGRYGGDVMPAQNNYAGIGATGGVPGNSFATPELGVIAHYAHLAWYVYPDHLDDPYCTFSVDPSVPGDPRHFVIGGQPHRGNVRVAGDLSGKWSVGMGYGASILAHARNIPVTVGW